MANDNELSLQNQAFALANESLEEERARIQQERDAFLAASNELNRTNNNFDPNAVIAQELSSLSEAVPTPTELVEDENELDEDDLMIEQLTGQLKELQELLKQQQEDEANAKKAAKVKEVVEKLSLLLNHFQTNYQQLSETIQSHLKDFNDRYLEAKNDFEFVDLDLLSSLKQEIGDYKLTFNSNFQDQIQSVSDELVLALEYLEPEFFEALEVLIKKVDINATGLIPNNLALKLYITQKTDKLDRNYDALENLDAAVDLLIVKKEAALEKTQSDVFVPIANPYKESPIDVNQAQSAEPVISKSTSASIHNPLVNNSTLYENAPEFLHQADSSTPEFTNEETSNELDMNKEELNRLTAEIEKVRDTMQQEIIDLQKANEEKEAKWKAIFENETAKYETEIANLKGSFEATLAEKQKHLNELISDKIEAKTSELLEGSEQKLTREDLQDAYKEIVDDEQSNFISELRNEHANLKQQIENERNRFEGILALKSKEWAQEKDELVKTKNARLSDLESKMNAISSERDRLLEEKNSLLIDLQNLTVKNTSNKPSLAINGGDVTSHNRKPALANDVITEVNDVISTSETSETQELNEEFEPNAGPDLFNKKYFSELNALRASKIDKEIAKAEAAQKKAQALYSQFENQRASLQEQLKLAHERNSIDKLTTEITARVSEKFENELQSLRAQLDSPVNYDVQLSGNTNYQDNQYNSGIQYQQDILNPTTQFQLDQYQPQPYDNQIDYNAPMVAPYGYPINPASPEVYDQQSQYEQQSARYENYNAQYQEYEENTYNQPPYGYQGEVVADANSNQNYDQPVVKPQSRKAVFLKENDGSGRLSSEEIRRYANAIIAANRRKQVKVN
ncbi:coiled-coil domain-containing protein [[Mycoplasma] testudinis]|uniref:hypothetical protein n=1 Tax=[Mycoplasma] testudinis TaxID=33924 RepID=UPI0004829166|nr:hypothetical protein [[Mycoplasma] testudinis]